MFWKHRSLLDTILGPPVCFPFLFLRSDPPRRSPPLRGIKQKVWLEYHLPRTLIDIFQFSSGKNPARGVFKMTLALKMWSVKRREVQRLAEGHTAGRRQSQDLDLALELVFCTLTLDWALLFSLSIIYFCMLAYYCGISSNYEILFLEWWSYWPTIPSDLELSVHEVLTHIKSLTSPEDLCSRQLPSWTGSWLWPCATRQSLHLIRDRMRRAVWIWGEHCFLDSYVRIWFGLGLSYWSSVATKSASAPSMKSLWSLTLTGCSTGKKNIIKEQQKPQNN